MCRKRRCEPSNAGVLPRVHALHLRHSDDKLGVLGLQGCYAAGCGGQHALGGNQVRLGRGQLRLSGTELACDGGDLALQRSQSRHNVNAVEQDASAGLGRDDGVAKDVCADRGMLGGGGKQEGGGQKEG